LGEQTTPKWFRASLSARQTDVAHPNDEVGRELAVFLGGRRMGLGPKPLLSDEMGFDCAPMEAIFFKHMRTWNIDCFAFGQEP